MGCDINSRKSFLGGRLRMYKWTDGWRMPQRVGKHGIDFGRWSLHWG